MTLKEKFKKPLTQVLVATALISPLSLTACNGRDVAFGVGAAAAVVASSALNRSYYRNSCYSSYYDYYCNDNWNGWYGRPWYRGGWGLEKPTAHLANAEVISGGLQARYHMNKNTAGVLGQAFADARQGSMRGIHNLGFTNEDLQVIAQSQQLGADRLQALAYNLGLSVRTVQRLANDLAASYQQHAANLQ